MGKRHDMKPSSPIQMVHQEPPIIHQQPPAVTTRGGAAIRYWNEDWPMPDHVAKVRRVAQPCPKCRRVYRDDGRQAAVCTGSGDVIATFRCKECGHRWKMPVREK